MASCPACKQPLPTLRGLEPAARDEVAFELGMGEADRAAEIVSKATGLGPRETRAYLACPHIVPASETQAPAFARCPACGRELAIKIAPQVAAALAHGQKIEAIKLVREATGWGLKQAKDFVECPHEPRADAMPLPSHAPAPARSKLVLGCVMAFTVLLASGIAFVFLLVQYRRQEQRASHERAAERARLCPDCKRALPSFPNATEADREAVLDHIRFARKISAIKLVRERTGWGLKEAKDFVDCPHRTP